MKCFSFVIAAASLVALTSGCKFQSASQSAAKVINGVPASDYPEVIELANGCTGTWISPTTVITAVHCVEAASPQVGGARPESVKTQRTIGSANGKDICETDVALLMFSADDARRIYPGRHLRLAQNHPGINDPVTIVGYGCNEWRGYPSKSCTRGGEKRQGSNSIASFTDGAIMLLGTNEAKAGIAEGEKALNAPGDSGGPLLNSSREIIGITSTGNGRLGFFTNTNSPGASVFLADALRNSDLDVKPRPAIDPYMPAPPELALSRQRLDAAMKEFRTWFEQEHPALLAEIDANIQSIKNTQDEVRATQEENQRLIDGLRK